MAVYHATDTTTATLALMSNLEAASIYSFLFLPAFNNQGIAAKVRESLEILVMNTRRIDFGAGVVVAGTGATASKMAIDVYLPTSSDHN